LPEHIKLLFPNNSIEERNKLIPIHNKLKIDYGNFLEEYPEQRMIAKYITGNEKILELGANIGRSTLILGYLLKEKKSNNLVTLECDAEIYEKVKHNRDINDMHFHIENAALSKRKLIQHGWNTICCDVLLDGYKNVPTITLEELYKKYNIAFDTLVLDCEGAFYYILMDMPEILNSINLIIMENDYSDVAHKNYIDDILKKNKFKRDYVECGGFGVCSEFFYEVWKK